MSQLDATLTRVPLTLTFDLDLWPWIVKVKLYFGNERPDCHGMKGTGVYRMPWYETLKNEATGCCADWVTSDLDLWPWIFKVKLNLGNGRPNCHGTCFHPLVHSVFPSTRLVLAEINPISELEQNFIAWILYNEFKICLWKDLVDGLEVLLPRVILGLGNGLLPDDTKPLPQMILFYYQRCYVPFTWEQFHN